MKNTENDIPNLLNDKLEELWLEMAKVLVGRKKELKFILTALLSEGHVLLEDLPGTGKTTMVKTFSDRKSVV